MYGVVLAAGRGTRMRPLTDRCPKPMLPVGDRTLIEVVFDTALDVVDEFVVVVSADGGEIHSAIGDHYRGVPITYVDQGDPKGTAHAISQVEPNVDDDFIVLNGDVLVDDSLPRRLAGVDGTAIAATEVDDPRAYGVISTTETGSLDGIVEKPAEPPTRLANVGCYRFETSVFAYLDRTGVSERGEHEVTDTLAHLLADGEYVEVIRYDGTWLDVGRPWELLAANELAVGAMSRRIDGTVEDRVTLDGTVIVKEGARVRSGAYIEGPALIRRGATVGPNAYIRGSTVIGPDAHVGHGVEVKNSLLMAGATVGHLSYVGDSVLGREVNFGAGTNVANLRHDDEHVRVTVKGERVDTGRRKFGTVVGDGAKTGINTSLNAGVTLGTDARTKPGESLVRDRNSH